MGNLSGKSEQSGKELGEQRAGVGRAHEGLANQKGVYIGFAQPRDVFPTANAGFGHWQARGGNAREQRAGAVKIDGKGFEVAAVDANQRRGKRQGAFQLVFVVNSFCVSYVAIG